MTKVYLTSVSIEGKESDGYHIFQNICRLIYVFFVVVVVVLFANSAASLLRRTLLLLG